MNRSARWAGICVQGLVLGVLLLAALLKLFCRYGGGRIFRYEGF